MPIPTCARCGEPKQQRGRYADFTCPCCDESARCRHVKPWTRLLRRFGGRRT